MTNNTTGLATASGKPKLYKLDLLLGEFRTDLDAAYASRQSGKPRGPVTGLTKLDIAMGTYLAPGLHILQAAPGAGKTALALQAASDSQCPALYISAEMSVLELFRRLVSRQTKTFLGKLKDGSMSGSEGEQLAIKTIKQLPDFAILDATREFADPTVIRDIADGMRQQTNSDHCLVVIDSLHAWARSSRPFLPALLSEYELLNQLVKSASTIAADLQCPVVLVAHRNRQSQTNGGIHAAKGTGDIEYFAESVIDLDRDGKAMPDSDGRIEVTAKIQKNRNGIPGQSITLQFEGRIQSFTQK